MSFDTLEIIYKAIDNNKLSHSFIISSNKTSTANNAAESIAQKLLKTKSIFTHPDFFKVRPSGKSRFIKIGSKENNSYTSNSIRGLISSLSKSSSISENKVAIIYEVDRMNKEAANAFLKILEEPPRGTYIILTTNRPNDLISTIRSRCLNFRVKTQNNFESIESWEEFKKGYWDWLSTLIQGYDKRKLGHIFFQAYGLISQLMKTLKDYNEITINAENPEEINFLDEDERKAYESGAERTSLNNILENLSTITCTYIKKFADSNDSLYLIREIDEIQMSLERTFSLLKLNFNTASALELYFLKTMRIMISANKANY